MQYVVRVQQVALLINTFLSSHNNVVDVFNKKPLIAVSQEKLFLVALGNKTFAYLHTNEILLEL